MTIFVNYVDRIGICEHEVQKVLVPDQLALGTFALPAAFILGSQHSWLITSVVLVGGSYWWSYIA